MKKDQGLIPFIMQMTVFARLPKRRGLRPSLTMDSLLASFAILAAVTMYNKSVANINVNKDEENAFFLSPLVYGKKKKGTSLLSSFDPLVIFCIGFDNG